MLVFDFAITCRAQASGYARDRSEHVAARLRYAVQLGRYRPQVDEELRQTDTRARWIQAVRTTWHGIC